MSRPRNPASVQSRIRTYLHSKKGEPVTYSQIVYALGLTKDQVWNATTDLVIAKCAARVPPHAVRALEPAQ